MDDSPPGLLARQPDKVTTTHLVQRNMRESVLQARNNGVAAQQGRLAVGDLHLQRDDLPPQRL
jgi:hypothetical protein